MQTLGMLRHLWLVAPLSVFVACGGSDDSPAKAPDAGSSGGASGSGGSGGATGGNGGGGTGGTTDAGADSAMDAPSDPCATALFCEDFEGQELGTPPSGAWTDNANGNGSVSVSDTRAVSGSRSAHFSTDGAASYQRAYISLEGAPVFPLTANAFYGRMMVWLASPPNDGVHWTMIQGEGAVAGETYTSVYRYGGQHHDQNGASRLMANYDTGGGVSSDCWQHSQTAMPTGSWACVEWHFDGEVDQLDFWLDGAPLADLTVLGEGEGCIANGTGGKWFGPTFDQLQLGLESYQTDEPRELWIDDVVIDDERVGCP
jgi:hypothetical protein